MTWNLTAGLRIYVDERMIKDSHEDDSLIAAAAVAVAGDDVIVVIGSVAMLMTTRDYLCLVKNSLELLLMLMRRSHE